MTRIGGGRANADNQWRQGGGGVWNFANLADVTCEQHLDLARLKAESGGLVFENPFDHKVPKVKQGHSKTKRPQRWNWKVNFWPRLNSPLLAINLGPAFKNSQSCSSQHCHNKRWKTTKNEDPSSVHLLLGSSQLRWGWLRWKWLLLLYIWNWKGDHCNEGTVSAKLQQWRRSLL